VHHVRLELRRDVGDGGDGVRRGGRGCGSARGCGRGYGGRGRSFSFGCGGGGPEFGKPLPGWQQDDPEDHAEAEDSRGHREGYGVAVGGRDRRRQRAGVPGHEPDAAQGQQQAAAVTAAMAPVKALREQPASYVNEN
jgi:hypothetical protein